MNFQKQYILSHIEKGMRLDGRKLDETRRMEIEANPIENAEGSAKVKMGNTEVVVGVKVDVGEPFPDTPNEGVLIVNAEFSPLASPEFELGPPREKAVELARIVDRGIRESKCLDREKLCIKEGEKVWMVFIDIQPLTHDGNLIDAAGIAAIAALLNAKMPKYEKEKVFHEKKDKPLPVNDAPVPVTFGFMGGKLMVDPGLEEESAIESRLTITTKTNGNICAVQKGGTGRLSPETVHEAVEFSIKRGKEIRELIKKSL
ncbi:MAG: exosome complex protein Rrp42 [Candidatus Aenigmatarchaeota archaeon]|nr:MAG: exosome complex protein Rrp42 [Candidatus Aenigmarchaeota archaeon]